MQRKAFHAIVTGRVQGVSFRYHTRRTANRLGLTGFVKNLPSGQVEVFAQGPEAELEEFSGWLHQGPSGARVDTVESEPRDVDSSTGSFEILF